jgi:hypothetical protein
MPTEAEFEELYYNTTVAYTQQNGVNGILLTADNGNSLFLPAAGYRYGTSLNNAGSRGLYWLSSLYGYPGGAWCLYFDYSGDYYWSGCDRDNGLSVRPVRPARQN